jgi:hypothetical protein
MVLSSVLKVEDESKVKWCPTSTPLGGLPHLSNIPRKPDPLGTELKVVVDGVLGCMLVMEIQKG